MVGPERIRQLVAERPLLTVSLVLNGVLVAIVLIVGVGRDDDTCGPAAEWREATQAWLVASNATDEFSSDRLARIRDTQKIAADVLLPPPRESSGALVHALWRANADAERWLSAFTTLVRVLSALAGGGNVGGAGAILVIGFVTDEADARRTLNQTHREVNALLVADCGIEPMALDSDE